MDTPSPRSISCPKCLVLMERLALGSVEVDRCVKCGGIWLDAGELSYLLADRAVSKGEIRAADAGQGPDQTRTFAVGQMICPRDKSVLGVRRDARQTHVEYEVCPTCGGVFLDAGELTDLNEFTLRERVGSILGRD